MSELTSAQKRMMEDLKSGAHVYLDKDGRILNNSQPRMDLPSIDIVNKSALKDAEDSIESVWGILSQRDPFIGGHVAYAVEKILTSSEKKLEKYEHAARCALRILENRAVRRADSGAADAAHFLRLALKETEDEDQTT
jgi:hypothetical protein